MLGSGGSVTSGQRPHVQEVVGSITSLLPSFAGYFISHGDIIRQELEDFQQNTDNVDQSMSGYPISTECHVTKNDMRKSNSLT